MKKLLLLLVGAFVAFAAHADLYLLGANVASSWTDGLQSGKWTPSEPLTVKLVDGYYCFSAKGDFKISTAKGNNSDDWNSFNGSAIAVNAKSGDQVVAAWPESGTVRTQTMVKNAENSTSPWGDNGQTYYRISENKDETYTIEAAQNTSDFTSSSSELTYQIKGDFTGNGWPLKNLPYTHTFDGTQKAQEWGIQDNNGKYYSNKAKFSGTKLTLTLANNDGNNEIQANYKGTVKFSVSGNTLTVEPVSDTPTPGNNDYTVYFYTTPEEASKATNLKAYVWSVYGNLTSWANRESMTSTGKFVYVSGKYCPVWEYKFTWTKKPEHIIFSYGPTSGTQTGTLDFVNEGFYTFTTSANKPPLTHLSLTDQDDQNYIIYMHFKEDYLKEGDQNYVPQCHIYNKNSGSAYVTGNWPSASSVGAPARNMFLVSAKYQIWGYKVDKAKYDGENYDNVIFMFKKTDGSWMEYKTESVDGHDGKHTKDFIYATQGGATPQDGGKAPQSYLTYEDFTHLDALGRPEAYVVGEPNLKIEVDGTESQLKWEPVSPTSVTPEDGCFYLKLTPDFKSLQSLSKDEKPKHMTINDRFQLGFKVGWINVAQIIQWDEQNGILPADKKNIQREWATFDLGIIGVNDLDKRVTDYGKIRIQVEGKDGGYPGQLAMFMMNSSVSYLNYNQYNWTLVQAKDGDNDDDNDDGTMFAKDGTPYYAVIDTHPNCRSVTLCTQNPQPQLVFPETKTYTLTIDNLDDARGLHDEFLHGAALNGPVVMTKVNYITGTATIQAVTGPIWSQAGFDRLYSISVNGETVIQSSDAKEIPLNYMPMSADAMCAIRAKYTDQETGITFHSRKSEIKVVSEEVTFPAPTEVSLDGKLMFEGYAEEDPNIAIYGMYVAAFECPVESEFNHYADFDATVTVDGKSEVKDIEIIHSGSAIAQKYPNLVNTWGADGSWNAWTPAASVEEFTADNDWAGRLQEAGQKAPVFIHDVLRVAKGTKPSAVDYSNVHVTGNIYAVYPFIYDPDVQVSSASSAPARISAGTAPEGGYEGFLVANTSVPKGYTVNITGITAGVDGVEADAITDGEVEYFTVSGVRVEGDPAPGIYIRRQGTAVDKVVIR